MSIKFSTSGRPMIECINPDCKKLHAIYRRGDYVKRAQVNVSCRACGTKWNLNHEDKVLLQKHYEQRQQELEDKKREKEQKNQQQQNLQKNQQQTNKHEKNQKEEKTNKKKRGWLDELLS